MTIFNHSLRGVGTSVAVLTQDLNFLLWYQPPTGTPLVPCGGSPAGRWGQLRCQNLAAGKEPHCLPGPPSRKHCPHSVHRPPSARVNGCLSSEKAWSRDTVPYPQSALFREKRQVLKYFKAAGQPTASSGLHLKSELRRGNTARLKSWCTPSPPQQAPGNGAQLQELN